MLYLLFYFTYGDDGINGIEYRATPFVILRSSMYPVKYGEADKSHLLPTYN